MLRESTKAVSTAGGRKISQKAGVLKAGGRIKAGGLADSKPKFCEKYSFRPVVYIFKFFGT